MPRYEQDPNGIWHAMSPAGLSGVGLCGHLFEVVRGMPIGEAPAIAFVCYGCRAAMLNQDKQLSPSSDKTRGKLE